MFIVAAYADGRSLRELAELTDRSHSAVRNILAKHGVLRRPRGAAPTVEDSRDDACAVTTLDPSQAIG